MNDQNNKTEPLSTMFIDFKGEFERQNILLKFFIVFISILTISNIFLYHINSGVWELKNVPFILKTIPKERVCYWGMVSILQNNASGLLVDKNLIKNLIKMKITFPFKINKLHENPKMMEENLCRIIFEDDTALVGFNVKMKSDDGYNFQHKVFDFDEFSVKWRKK